MIQARAIDIVVLPWVKMSTAPMVVEAFEELGLEAAAVGQDDFVPAPDRIAFLGGNARFHEPVLERVRSVPPAERPFVVVWHTEPLPLPRASGLRTARLTVRELAKIILR